MAAGDVSLDFMDEITNVNFGNLWLGIIMGVSFVVLPDPSEESQCSVSCNFPTQAGGTPGFGGFVNNKGQSGFDPTTTLKTPPRTKTNAGAGFTGYNIGIAALMQIGSGVVCPSNKKFTINFPCSATADHFGDEGGGIAQVSLIDASNIVPNANVFILAEGTFAKKQLAQATNHFFTSIPGPMIFVVDPVKKTVTTSGGQGH